METGEPTTTGEGQQPFSAATETLEPVSRRGPGGLIRDWNVVITVHQGGSKCVRKLLRDFGAVSKSGFRDVLVMRADDPERLLEDLAERSAREPDALAFLSRVVPVYSTFTFQSPEEFEAKACDAALTFLPVLAAKGFHVRMYRHGLKGRLSSHQEERLLGAVLQEALEKAGTPGHVTFEDPDAILAVETVGNRAGLSLWTREQLLRYPFLRLD